MDASEMVNDFAKVPQTAIIAKTVSVVVNLKSYNGQGLYSTGKREIYPALLHMTCELVDKLV